MMPAWQFVTALAITLLVGLTTYIVFRRPPAALVRSLPLLFGSALIFSVGDMIANRYAQDELFRWVGMIMVYTGLLAISPAWLLFTRNFSEVVGDESIAPWFDLKYLVGFNVLLWIGLITNPWHHQFLMEIHPAGRSIYGPLWYATAIPNYLVILVAMWAHVRASRRATDPAVASQFRFLASAAAIPVSLNMVYVWNVEPFTYDPTALGFAVSCALFLYAVERLDLFGLERVSLPRILKDDPDAILIVSLHHGLQWANSAAHTLFGSGHLVVGAPVDDLFERVVPSFSLSDTSRESSTRDFVEHRFVSALEEVRWVVIEVSPVYGKRQVPSGLCLRLRDNTALRAKTREADQNQEILDDLREAIGEGIVIQDRNGRIRHVNQAFYTVFKLSDEVARGGPRAVTAEVETSIVKGPSKSMRRLWHRSAEEFDSTQSESADFILKDGCTIYVQTFPIKTHRGFTGRAWRLTDVTQARNESRAMIQSQKLEGLGVLAGGIAHDFNNLLVAILGNAEIAREELEELSPESEALAPLADVEAAAVRASELTGQLLAYAGKTAIAKEDLDLSSLIRDAAALISVSIPKNVKIVRRLEKGLPLVRGGAAELRQVAMNLLTNAADAIGTEGGTITIETGLGTAGPLIDANASVEIGQARNPTVYLCVRDDGLGMDAATLEKIFDPFFTTKFTGRGLGLAATRGILDSHDGSLRIETGSGVGSAFSVMLPIRQAAVNASPPSVPADIRSGFVGYRVLVIDDEESIRTLLTKRLEAVDFEVLTACSGDEGLSLLEAGESIVDLVILDLTMPGLSGIETHARIRLDYPDLPVLLSSGYTAEEVLTVLPNGDTPLDGFIQKPYRSAALLSRIERLLSSRPDAAVIPSAS